MGKFAYQVRDAGGHTDSGVLVADSINGASRLLRKDGKFIVSLREDSGHVAKTAPAVRKGGRINRDEIIFFCTQLAVMVDTGVPLADALDCIAEQSRHLGFQQVVKDIAEQVKGGTEFSAALEKYPKLFSRLFISLMRASEASGKMGPMLRRASDYMQQERETVKRIKGALVYPICMLSFCVLVVVALLVFVLPKFASIYQGKGAVLPLPTRLLMGASDGIREYWYVILSILGLLVVGGHFYFKTLSGRMLLDNIRLNLPIFGSMFHKACLARSLRTMSTMISTGVSIVEGLTITAQVSGNYYFSRIWEDLSKQVQEGQGLSENLAKSKLIPPSVAAMIAAGEKTGKLAPVMDRVAEFCEDDLKVAVKTVTTMIEPVMIILMGLLIGGIAISLLLPVFNVSKLMTH